MKTKFKSDEIAHAWAHQSAPHGDSPSAMSFNGPLFKSYAAGIAKLIEHKGKKAVIFNERSYSVTTSAHQGYVLRAIPDGIPVFRTNEDAEYANKEGLYACAVEKAAECLTKSEKARVRSDSLKAQAHEWLESAKQINAFFGLRKKVDMSAIERLKVATARAERKAAKQQSEREAKMRAEQQEAYAAWLRGEDGGYFNYSAFPVSFRVEGSELVSTLGARVPLDEARKALRFVVARKSKGWHRNGEVCPVGSYQLDAINEQGVVAGCHRILWSEIERLATVLG